MGTVRELSTQNILINESGLTSLRPMLFLLSLMLLQGVCKAQNPHARAIASTNAGYTEDNSGLITASAAASGPEFGISIAQAYVTGIPAPSISLPYYYPLYVGASTSNDTGELAAGQNVSMASALWNDRMTIVSPTSVNQVIFSVSLRGSMKVSVKEDTIPDDVFPEAEATAQLQVYTDFISQYTVRNYIPRRSASAFYETSMTDNVTADIVNYADPNNNGTTIRYLLPVRENVISFGVTLRTISVSQNAIARASFSDTAILTGVFLADGTTPESNGMTLVFDSGVPSPNIVVPEAQSITLLGLGLIGAICRVLFRPLRRRVT